MYAESLYYDILFAPAAVVVWVVVVLTVLLVRLGLRARQGQGQEILEWVLLAIVSGAVVSGIAVVLTWW